MSTEISDIVTSLAATLKGDMSMEDGGVITLKGDAFESTLPDGLSMSDFNAANGHVENVVAALTLATGQMGEGAMKKNKSLESVSSEMKLGKHGSISVGYVRNQEGTKSPTDRTPVTRHGIATTRLVTIASKSNRGQLKKVRSYLSSHAAEMFK